ncbi:MAG: hypothetical protein KGL09_01025 [Pseudomonadota bacterium]|nr:hypothetical protein [Pseudomonadota bacterium]
MATESVATHETEIPSYAPDISCLINTLTTTRLPGSYEYIEHCGKAASVSLATLWSGIQAIGDLMEIAASTGTREFEVFTTAAQLGSLLRMLAQLGEALTATQENAHFWAHNETADSGVKGCAA